MDFVIVSKHSVFTFSLKRTMRKLSHIIWWDISDICDNQAYGDRNVWYNMLNLINL